MNEHLAFLESQAAYIESEVYQIRYADIQYPMLVPVDTSAPPFAGQITYYSQDGTGEAQFLANRGNDFPLVDTQRAQHNVRIENLGIGYDYDMFELGLAMRLGVNLSTDKAAIARRVSEEKIDDIVLRGQADMGWDGLINSTLVNTRNADNGTAGTPQWNTKTPLEILADVQNALGDVWTSTRQVELADTVLLSPERYLYLTNTPLGDNSDKNIMEYLMQYNVWTMQTGMPLMIRTVRGLETAGGGNSQRMIVYRRDRQALRFHMPMPLMFLEPQQILTRYIVPGVFRLGGLELRLPGSMRYIDSI